jgi:hypothetical protein
MIETLKNIMDIYHSGLLSTPNIQVSGKIFSAELIADLTFASSTFKNSHFINILSYSEVIVIQNSFLRMSFRSLIKQAPL